MPRPVSMNNKLPEAFTVKDNRYAATSIESIGDDAEAFRKAGFTHVLSVQPGVNSRAIEAAGMKWLGLLNIEDYHPATPKQRARFYQILDSLPTDARLVIHCTAGKGRSPMMLAILLVHKHGYTPDAAIAEVQTNAKQMRNGLEVIETPAQHQAIHDAAKDESA